MTSTAVVPILVAVVLVFLAWKLLGGLIKTVALLAILVVAVIFVFGVMH